MNTRALVRQARVVLCGWPQYLRRSPTVRMVLLASLAALTLGGRAKGPGNGSELLERIGSWPAFTRGPAVSVALTGHHALVAIGEGGLLVLDVADPSRPLRVGGYRPPGRTDLVRTLGKRAYLATAVHAGGGCQQEGWRGRLVILDVSDPARPSLLGSYLTIDTINSFSVEGNRVYLSDRGYGLQILDVANPARPVALRVGWPKDVWLTSVLWASTQQVYAERYDSWGVLDVSEPGSPRLTTTVPVREDGARISTIQANSNHVYVLETSNPDRDQPPHGWLSIYEAGAAQEPVLLGTLHFDGLGWNVRVSGKYAYVAMAREGMMVIDVSNPHQPVRIGTWPTSGTAVQVEIGEDHAFVADYQQGLQVLDIRNPSGPVQVARFDTGLTSRKVGVSGSRAYVLSSDTHPSFQQAHARSVLEILDISNPTKPILLGSHEAPWDDLMDMLVDFGFEHEDGVLRTADGHAYSAQGWSGFEIREVLSPTEQVLVGTYDTVGEVHDLWVTNHYAYVAEGWEGIEVVDMRQPAEPFPIGRLPVRGQARGIQVSGNNVYVAEGGGGLAILSLAPAPVTIVEDPVSLSAGTGEPAT